MAYKPAPVQPTLLNVIVSKEKLRNPKDHVKLTYANGNVYTGPIRGGRMHGHGKLIWSDGLTYEGEFEDNVLQGKGQYTWTNGSTYTGEVVAGVRNGEGTLIDGDLKFVGQWRAGLKHGKGLLSYNKAATAYYDGEWCDDLKNGYGKNVYASGNVYEGQWSSNLKNGEGTMHWIDRKERYVGGWKDGQPDGSGEHTWYADAPMDGPVLVDSIDITRTEVVLGPNGDIIEGSKPSEPEETNQSHHPGRRGSVSDDKKKKRKEELSPRHGAASPFGRFAQLNSYKGNMKMGHREGVGRFSYANGASYNGGWVGNEKLGEGTQALSDGTLSADMYGKDRPRGGRRTSICRPASMVNSRVSPVDREAGIDFESIIPGDDRRQVQKVKDMLFRWQIELEHVFLYYCAMGTTTVEQVAYLDLNNYCQFCRDCRIPSRRMPLIEFEEIFHAGYAHRTDQEARLNV